MKLGLVTSLARPGGNLTGVNWLVIELVAKRLELVRGMVPGARRVAVLVDPNSAATSEFTVKDVQSAAQTMGLQTRVLDASTSGEINAAFATFVGEQPDALFVGPSAFLVSRRMQVVHLGNTSRSPSDISSA